jgi:paraquat-inducible protein B
VNDEPVEKKEVGAGAGGGLPRPVVKKMRWPFPLVWLVPVLALVLAGFYYGDYLKDQGPEITIKFKDASGLKPGQTQVTHRGVSVGKVTRVELSADKLWALVHVRLVRAESSIAQTGTSFWVVRPEISGLSVSGLGTVVSGPYIEAMPGGGEAETAFVGLQRAPLTAEDGLVVILHVDHLEHLSPDAPVYYRGVQVGIIQAAQLGEDATRVDVYVLVWPQYRALVHTDTEFWIMNGFDLKGGLFTGVKAKLDSLTALVSGAVAFATPDDGKGVAAETGAEFQLNEEPKKEWLKWSPKIPVTPTSVTQTPEAEQAKDMRKTERALNASGGK